MTLQLTHSEFNEQFQAADQAATQWDPQDDADITYQFDAHISQGWRREIDLRDGMFLCIDRHQLTDNLLMIANQPEREEKHSINCFFCLSGQGEQTLAFSSQDVLIPRAAGKYSLRSNGLDGKRSVGHYPNLKPHAFLQIAIPPSLLRSFVSTEGDLPKEFRHLAKLPDQELFIAARDTQPLMKTVLQQILHCSYQGMVKRAYLEGKAIELVALVLDHETVIQQGDAKGCVLKPEQLEQIHYAKEILLRDLSNPPSLEQLAHQVGLNDFLLKQGFRQVFGTTVFGELQTYRLETAKQLLAEQDTSVAKVAHSVGYASLSSFSRAFKQRFGITPKQHQKACR